MGGTTLKLLGEFNFGAYLIIVTTTLYEAQTEIHYISQKWLTVKIIVQGIQYRYC
jgi:hypothetical protein